MCRPSEILGITEDTYTAFCFDEACTELMLRLMNKEKPLYREQIEQNGEPKHYSSFKDFYKNIGG